jgi:hypothetical protein
MTADRTPVVTGRNPPVRVDWVDYAKGICIVMVVMMHSVLGVELAAGQTGFMHPLVESGAQDGGPFPVRASRCVLDCAKESWRGSPGGGIVVPSLWFEI